MGFWKQRQIRKQKAIKELYAAKLAKEKMRTAAIDEYKKNMRIMAECPPDKWIFPELKSLHQLLPYEKRVWEYFRGKLTEWRIIKIKPAYYVVCFFPNHRVMLQKLYQHWDNTLRTKQRHFQINPEKVWMFGADAVLFYNHDNAEPLTVNNKIMETGQINTSLYKKVNESNILSDLLTEKAKFSEKLILYILLAVGAVVVLILGKTMGWF